MKHCILMPWKSMVVHERHSVALEVHGKFGLGSIDKMNIGWERKNSISFIIMPTSHAFL